MKPIASMTGFAVAAREAAAGTVSVELKSVNARFLDLTVRIAEELRHAEPALREAIAAAIARGKLECRVGWQRSPASGATRLNPAAIDMLAQLETQVRARLSAAQPLSVAEVLAWDGVIAADGALTEQLRDAALAALADALHSLQQSRAREGEATRTALFERCAAIEAIVAKLRERAPDMLAALEKKLSERLTQALAAPLGSAGAMSREEIGERIRQEVTLYGQRADVDEELNRLATHVTEVRRVLTAGGPVGRRLDFLMQELNREANTLGSKATAIELTHAAVDLKLAIEQMREQIQNLE
jgi:uncharacterized protein (TIGR00255 family)